MASKQRVAVSQRGGRHCHYCGYETWLTVPQKEIVEKSFPQRVAPGKHRRKAIDARTFTVDHVVPQAAGGGNTTENKVPCCKLCNSMKGDAPEHQFRALVSYLKKMEIHPFQIFQRTGIWFVCEHIPVKSLKTKKDAQNGI